LNQWVVVLSGPQAVEDIRQAADDELSLQKAVDEVCVIINPCGPDQQYYSFSLLIIRSGRISILVNIPSRLLVKILHVLFVDLFAPPQDPYHTPIIRNQLTKNLGVLSLDIRDEIVQAFDDEIRPTAGKSQAFGHTLGN
jgi:hypothetical protein